jgi:hypothetical protein
MGIIRKAKNKIIDITSDIMSAPARIKAKKSMLKADQDIADLKMVREMRGVDSSDMDWRDPLFRARANVSGLKYEAEYARKRANAKSNK